MARLPQRTAGLDPPAHQLAAHPADAARLREGEPSAVYVSGDQRATAERLLQLAVAPSRVAGDACARTTWENATLTSRAFQRQALSVNPLAAAPSLAAAARNRLALREASGTLLDGLQGRI